MVLQQVQTLVVGEENWLLSAIIEYADKLLASRAKDLVATIAFKPREDHSTLAIWPASA